MLFEIVDEVRLIIKSVLMQQQCSTRIAFHKIGPQPSLPADIVVLSHTHADDLLKFLLYDSCRQG